MASKKYSVKTYDQHTITLTPASPTLGSMLLKAGATDVVIQRAHITATTRHAGGLRVSLAGGTFYDVLGGIRSEQRNLTGAAFGISL